MNWELRSQVLDLNHCRMMGVLNVTPDSFSDGGTFEDPHAALDRALQIQEEGADILDIGAESTRPGSSPVTPDQEKQRLEGVLSKIKGKIKIPLSLDTRHGEVAEWALQGDMEIINDISGGQDPKLLQTVREHGVGYVLMHMRGTPLDMMEHVQYGDVSTEVYQELRSSLLRIIDLGISPKKICIDPGFGFAKTPQQNLRLLDDLNLFARLNQPILVGLSRKRMIRELTGTDPGALRAGSIAAALLAYQRGARIFRVHDVAETRMILMGFQTLTKEGGRGKSRL